MPLGSWFIFLYCFLLACTYIFKEEGGGWYRSLNDSCSMMSLTVPYINYHMLKMKETVGKSIQMCSSDSSVGGEKERATCFDRLTVLYLITHILYVCALLNMHTLKVTQHKSCDGYCLLWRHLFRLFFFLAFLMKIERTKHKIIKTNTKINQKNWV